MLERAILISVWIVTTILLIWLIPKAKLHMAIVSFLIMQVPSWVLGLTVVELGFIVYPVRFFAHASQTSFTFEFYALPSMSALFNVYNPKGKWWRKLLFSLAFTAPMILCESIIEHYTKCIDYLHWTWYLSWISLLFVLHLAYWLTRWFMSTLKNN